MEAKDLEIIESNRKDNYQLDRLYKEHLDLEAQIDKLEAAKGLGAEEEKQLHNLKKQKLDGREQLEGILQGLR